MSGIDGLPARCLVDVTMADIIPEELFAFERRCNEAIIEKQGETIDASDPLYDMYVDGWKDGEPYGSAIGGFLSWVITPTSIGKIVKVRCDYLGIEEEITNYDIW